MESDIDLRHCMGGAAELVQFAVTVFGCQCLETDFSGCFRANGSILMVPHAAGRE